VPVNISIRDKIGENRPVGEQDFQPENLTGRMQRDGAEDKSFWNAVAERSGDTAFGLRTELPKRRGASLPAAVQILRGTRGF
jgi:hypothetical protein